jgi:glycosyltransferase involved in cell wall biosynthesis
MMAGVPVISHRSGGPTETMIDGKTGVFFEKLTAQSLFDAISRSEHITFESQAIHEHAMKYSSKVFKQKMEKLIENELKV